MPSSSISRITRLGIMLLDHFFMCIIMMIPMIPFLFYSIFNSFNAGPGDVPEMFDGPFLYLFALGLSLYICKDSINGRSIAKRIAKLQVVSNISGDPASPIQCLIRNVFIVIWPIEVIVSLFNTQWRMGDRVAGTRLAMYEPQAGQQTPKVVPIVATVAIAFVISALLFSLLPVPAQPGGKPSGQNLATAEALQERLQENIFYKVQFEVKVFDSIDHKLGTYVWVNGKLGKNYLEDNKTGDLLMEKIESQIDSVFHPDSYRGSLQLRYSGVGSMQMKSKTIGGKIILISK